MLDSVNPFSDPDIRKTILAKEGIATDDYENLEPDVQGDDMGEQIDSSPVDFKSLVSAAPKLPKSAKNIVMDAAALAKHERDEKSKEMAAAINTVFSNYNKEYGLDLNINLDNLSESLVLVSNERDRKILECYVTECYKSVKPILLLHLLQKLVLIMDYILKPDVLNSGQLSVPDMFVVVEKIESYIVSISDIIDSDAMVKDSGQILRKLAEEKNDPSLDTTESKEVVDQFMKLFNSENNKK